ncbi:hypothetical protein BK139_13060 [Paenibacillus sp. FSL R5-0490]|uniref:M42 family metallopeptidase n=1 Tax=Paenibacillus sp. FSL R5-0490 TaxID=1920424 RepID=UPI00096FA4E1|nr:M20/M25/M40 family metallo-hydrolase [Paenibacillus sp. FSL R5-0490]OMF59328.1 hypothetical protein BK139_13060 [Paenibacillus sp. FSL R5-0490]
MEQRLEDMIERLKELTSIVALSGYEDSMINYVSEKLAPLAAELSIDPLGNVIVQMNRSKDNAPFKVLVFAHMDELGLVVKKVEKNGFLRLERLGGIPEKSLAGTPIIIETENKTWQGVIGAKSHHVTKPDEKYRVLPVNEIYADFGFQSSSEALQAGIDIGTPVAYARQFFNNEALVFSNSLDNRAGCLSLLELADRMKDKEFPCEVYLVFSVQEEFNLRGVLPAIRKIKPDIGITLDISIATDTPDLENEGNVQLGGGPTIGLYTFHGRGTLGGVIPNPKFVKHIKSVASEMSMPLQPAVCMGILTDASFSQLENDGFPIVDLGYPARYSHSPIEAINLKDVDQLTDLLVGILHSLDGTNKFARG